MTSRLETETSLESHEVSNKQVFFLVFLLLSNMSMCAVSGCNNDNKCRKRRRLQFSRFSTTKRLYKRRIHACCRAEKLNPETARVCSDISKRPTMHKRKLSKEAPQAMRSLKADAVPSLFRKQTVTKVTLLCTHLRSNPQYLWQLLLFDRLFVS